ncbi:MAG TPA: hypothetical protein VKO66_05705, partial [Sideroxyarcus sp.]|nr:hypothetical protein [Sideroxyarcus sp.]
TVVVAELSEGTVAGEAESVIVAAVTVLAVPAVTSPLPPQLVSRTVIAASIRAVNAFAGFEWMVLIATSMCEMPISPNCEKV